MCIRWGSCSAMLVKGDAARAIRAPDVRQLSCSDDLKEIIYRCIGERRKRYESADELIEALQTARRPLRPGELRTLKGVAPRLYRRVDQDPAEATVPPARRRHRPRHAIRYDHGARSRPAESRCRPQAGTPDAS